ncbi:MAG: 50S ribosomal protein L14 [Candidatus Woesearchaeota archaeon]
MKGIPAKVTKAVQHRSVVNVCDNSGAKKIRIFTFVGSKTRKGRYPSGGVGDLVMASVIDGKPEMRKQVVYAVIVRQKKEYQRRNGVRICFEDNAAVIVKDVDGNPKGTRIKGPIAKEAAERWPFVAKLANMIV